MESRKFDELEDRASAIGANDLIRQLEARSNVKREIELMKAEGKAFELSREEEKMLKARPGGAWQDVGRDPRKSNTDTLTKEVANGHENSEHSNN